MTALREHQRFFAVERLETARCCRASSPCATATSTELDTVRKGNEDVLVARLEDARFYWDTDLKHKPSELVEKLSGVVWMEGLGSLRDKAARLEVAGRLARRTPRARSARPPRARRAAVQDRPAGRDDRQRQGVREPGRRDGRALRAPRAASPKRWPTAIAEHYRRAARGDQPPFSVARRCCWRSPTSSITWRARSWPARSPSGSEDPYGVRRAAQRRACASSSSASWPLDLRAAAMEITRAVLRRRLRPAAGGDHEEAGRVPALARGHGARRTAVCPTTCARRALEARIRPGAAQARQAGARRPTRWRVPVRSRRSAGDPRFAPLVILFKRVCQHPAGRDRAECSPRSRRRLSDSHEQALLAAVELSARAARPAAGSGATTPRSSRAARHGEAIHGVLRPRRW